VVAPYTTERADTDDRCETPLAEHGADGFGERREDGIPHLWQHDADDPEPLSAKLLGSHVAEDVDRSEDGVTGARCTWSTALAERIEAGQSSRIDEMSASRPWGRASLAS
jgi:hypothetical protein